MLHDIVMMCTCAQLYFLTLALVFHVREQYVTIRNMSFDVTVMLQQCTYHCNEMHSWYNVG